MKDGGFLDIKRRKQLVLMLILAQLADQRDDLVIGVPLSIQKTEVISSEIRSHDRS